MRQWSLPRATDESHSPNLLAGAPRAEGGGAPPVTSWRCGHSGEVASDPGGTKHANMKF